MVESSLLKTPTATAGYAIECRDLTKDFGGGRGVFDLDLVVKRGEVFGFIGPNGAGKSTTIHLLMDLVRPDRGSARLLDMDAHDDSLTLKARVGYLPGELTQWPGVSAAYVIGLLAGLRGGVDEDLIVRLADRLQIDLRQRYEQLSHGNKQKVGLIQAFMHRPQLLILDEPTLGLDPLVQREFRLLLRESIEDGSTVFLSSHVLSEVELVCDRIGVIRQGRLDRVGSLNELRARRIHRVDVTFEGTLDLAAIEGVPGVRNPTIDGQRLKCSVQGPIGPFLEAIVSSRVVELDSTEVSLEEVFFGEIEPPS